MKETIPAEEKRRIKCDLLRTMLMSNPQTNTNFIIEYANENGLPVDDSLQCQINIMSHYLNNYASRIMNEMGIE